jgi:hypothetical protein
MLSRHMPFDTSGMIVEFEYVRGHRGAVQPANCLGLVLVWTQTGGALNVLQLAFGLTYSYRSVYFRFGICFVVKTFCNEPLARVSISLMEEIETFKAAFGERHPLLNDCWAMMDGLMLYLQASGIATNSGEILQQVDA